MSLWGGRNGVLQSNNLKNTCRAYIKISIKQLWDYNFLAPPTFFGQPSIYSFGSKIHIIHEIDVEFYVEYDHENEKLIGLLFFE